MAETILHVVDLRRMYKFQWLNYRLKSLAQRKHAPGELANFLIFSSPVVEEDTHKTRISYNLQKDYHVQGMLSKFIVEEERHG